MFLKRRFVSMVDRGFGPGEVLNRRVSGHIAELLPANLTTRSEYYVDGRRWLHPDRIPGGAKQGICSLEAYVSAGGEFEIQVSRAFDPKTDHGWRCHNRIARTRAAGGRSLDPFEYLVRSALTIGGKKRTDRSTVDWATLGEDHIYGGREAQAAVLLCEAVTHRLAKSDEGFTSHHGSLSGCGSLSRVIDEGRPVDVDWETVDDLLGPDADTIAAQAGVEPIESEERIERARERGIEFLDGDLVGRLDDTGFADGDWRSVSDASPASGGEKERWRTLPGDVDPDEAAAKLAEMRDSIREMRGRDRDQD
jgi:hypothetical protein